MEVAKTQKRKKQKNKMKGQVNHEADQAMTEDNIEINRQNAPQQGPIFLFAFLSSESLSPHVISTHQPM